jgi:hypothetical protein
MAAAALAATLFCFCSSVGDNVTGPVRGVGRARSYSFFVFVVFVVSFLCILWKYVEGVCLIDQCVCVCFFFF